MFRKTLLVAALATGAAFVLPAPSEAQTAPTTAPTAMPTGSRMMLNAGLGQRVVRLENVNGML